MSTVLETTALTRSFGGLVAVDSVSIEFADSEITAIIGPNGAGKTTFYNLLTGVLTPTSGTVRLRPHDDDQVLITGKSPDSIARLGLSRAYQINNVFDGLTVAQNVRIACISRFDRSFDWRAVSASDPELSTAVTEILTQTNLRGVADSKCSSLSHGDVRKVEIAIALGTDPSVVLLDEPTAGMNATETQRMVELLRELDTTTDTTFVLTEHDMDVVRDVADRIIVFDDGSVIARGSPQTVLTDDRVTGAYLGGGST